MVTRRFVRTDSFRHLRLGKKRRKLQVWRRPRGTRNKLRLKRVGHPALPTVGHRTSKAESGRLKGLYPLLVNNLQDIDKATKENIIIIARVGAKKKLEMIKKIQEKGLQIANLGGKK
ncbi:MAG: eL32 family ribosomal protein [archaeon]